MSDLNSIDQDVLNKMFEELVLDNQKLERNKSSKRTSETPTRELWPQIAEHKQLKSNKSLISDN